MLVKLIEEKHHFGSISGIRLFLQYVTSRFRSSMQISRIRHDYKANGRWEYIAAVLGAYSRIRARGISVSPQFVLDLFVPAFHIFSGHLQWASNVQYGGVIVRLKWIDISFSHQQAKLPILF